MFMGEQQEEEGRSKLCIDGWAAIEENLDFNDNLLINTLEYYKNKEQTFEIVEINYPGISNTITKDVWNVAAGVLDSESQPTSLRLNFCGDTISDKNWYFDNPKVTESDVTLNVITEVTDDGRLRYNFANTVFPTDYAGFNCYTEEGRTDYTVLSEFMNSADYWEINDNGGNAITNIHIYFNKDVNEEERAYLNYDISDIGNLSANTDYYITASVYKGDIEESTDEEGNIHYEIRIAVEDRTEEEILDILEARKEYKFNNIYFIYPANGTTQNIDKDILNKSAELLNTESGEAGVNFGFVNEQTGTFKEWKLINPTGEQGSDQNVSFDIATNEDKKLTVSVSDFAFDAERVHVYYQVTPISDKKQELTDALGFVAKRFSAGGHITDGEYDNADWGTWLRIDNVTRFETDVPYEIEEYEYLGEAQEDGDALYLYIASHGMDKSKFEAEDVERIINYYASKGMYFDEVMIEEEHSDNNIIKKEYLNIARKLVVRDSDFTKSVSFVFCQCENDVVRDIVWRIEEPCEVTADINANITVTTDSRGVVLKNNAEATYLKGMVLQFVAGNDSPFAKDLSQHLGQPLNQELVVVDNELNIVDQTCFTSDNERVYIELYSPENILPNSEYVIVPVKEYNKKIIVGDELQLNVSRDVDKDTEVVWRVDDEYIAAVSNTGVMTALNDGRVYVQASYQSGGQKYIECQTYEIAYESKKISFNRNEITMELYDEEEIYEYLEVRWYPSNSAVSQQKLVWTTSDESVVGLCLDDDGKCRGGIRAVSPGTAVVKAQYNDEIYAECKITVVKAVVIPDEEYPQDIYLVANTATTLAGAKGLPANWRWKNPQTDISAITGLRECSFPAIYTDKNGRTVEQMLMVRIITITGISIEAVEFIDDKAVYVEKPQALAKGESVVLNYTINTMHGDLIDLSALSEQIKVEWSSKPADVGTQSGLEMFGKNSYKITADGNGKKTVSLSLINAKTNKLVVKDSYEVTCTQKPVINFDDVLMNIEWESDNSSSGKMLLSMKKEQSIALTIKSEDNAYLKLGKASVKDTEDGNIVTEVPFEFKKPGYAYVTVIAADEIKSKRTYMVSMIDSEPELLQTVFNINKQTVDKSAFIGVHYKTGYGAIEIKPVITGEYANKFAIESIKSDSVYTQVYKITLSDKSLSKGTYKTNIKIPVCINESTKEIKEYTKQITIKVTDVMPKLKIKQTGKVNLFYTDMEGEGSISISADGIHITTATFNDSCDYELIKDTGNNYFIRLKKNAKGDDKSAVLTYTVEGFDGSFSKNLNIKTVNKAPGVVLLSKTNAFYPKIGFNETTLSLADKTTGKQLIDISSVDLVISKNNKIPITGASTEIKTSKNTYFVKADRLFVYFKLGTSVSATDKFKLEIKKSNWSKAVSVNYNIKVITTDPKLILGSKKLTLNKNSAVYENQLEQTKISLNGRDGLPYYNTRVKFEGVDEKSKAALYKNLILEYNRNFGRIYVSFNSNNIDKGNYKYKVIVDTNGIKAETVLTINVTDVSPEKGIKIKANGSIDVLNRRDTRITYTANIKALTGFVTDAYLEGDDAHRFEAFYEGNGQLVVKAVDGENYSTKYKYKVKPVFVLHTEGLGEYEIKAPEQSIKLKQGKPHINIYSDSNVLYSNDDNELYINLEAGLGDKDVKISDVVLLNYTKDLKLKGIDISQDDESPAYANYNPNNKQICLSRHGYSQILKNGKKWNLKFQIKYCDKAGNEKDGVVSYKVVVR